MQVEEEFARATDAGWAAGMIVARRGGTFEQALAWIEESASASDRTVDEIVRDVLERRITVSK